MTVCRVANDSLTEELLVEAESDACLDADSLLNCLLKLTLMLA